jgi:hypothetical protein
MEMSQRNSLCSYLKQTKLTFFKKQNQGTGPIWRIGTSRRGEGVGKRCRRVNIVQILCTHTLTHTCKWKTETC